MTAIIAYLSENWVRWLFAAGLAGLTWGYRKISVQLDLERRKNEAIAAGIQSLLRESIVNNYNKYQERGWCPIYAKESLRRAYAAYHDLGGNDVATELYNKLLRMPEQEEKSDDNE